MQRLFADAGAVFDGVHAAFDRDGDALVSVRVRRDLPVKLRRLFDDGLHLVEIELRHVPDVAVRKHAAGCENLDDVDLQLYVLAHKLAKAVGTVRDSADANAGILFDPAWNVVRIAVAAGDRERLTSRTVVKPLRSNACALRTL